MALCNWNKLKGEKYIYETEKMTVLKTEIMGKGIHRSDRATPSIHKRWHKLLQQVAVAQSVQFARGLKPRSYLLLLEKLSPWNA
jgi:hypothetical protein